MKKCKITAKESKILEKYSESENQKHKKIANSILLSSQGMSPSMIKKS